jgi:hydrogenase 3 maturation protease
MNFDEFKKELTKYPPGKILFVGLGNEIRGDDCAGILFLHELEKQSEFSKSKFLNAGTNPENYLFRLSDKEVDMIIFIDAVQIESSIGEIFWIDSKNISDFSMSTHTYSIKMIETWLKTLRPIDIKYLGISAASFDCSKPVTEKVLNGIKYFFNRQ